MRTARLSSWLRRDWHWLVVSILAAHFVLGTIYSFATPIWEGPDEWGHYRHVRFLVENLSLPGPEDSRSPLDELTHPPLYYILTALATSWVDTSDDLRPAENPYVHTGITEGGVNRFIHSDQEAFPYRGTVLAVHVSRLVSVLMGTLVVAVTYWVGRLLFPERQEIAIGAMAINAFSPGFIFMASVINNDVLVTLFSSLVLFFSIKVIIQSPRLRDLLAIGVLTGLALLSKYNALALIPIVLISIGVVVARLLKSRRSLAVSLGGVLLLVLAAGLVYSWWFFRSIALFGTPTTRSAKIFAQFLQDIRDPLAGFGRVDWALLEEGLQYFYTSFWATFGWGNILAESWVYWLLAILCLGGVAGILLFVFGKASRPAKAGVLILIVSFVFFSILAIYRTLAVSDPVLRGRYALPAISAVSVLLTLGIVQLTPRRLDRAPIYLAGLTMFLLSVLALFRYVVPAYARPPIYSSLEEVEISNPWSVNFGNRIELLGYDLDVDRMNVGEFVSLTLYWRPMTQLEDDYTVGLAVLGPGNKPYGQLTAYPGRGNYPTSLWTSGDIIKDTYRLRVGRRFPAPSLARIYLALYTYPEEEYLFSLDSQGQPIDRAVIFGDVPVSPARPRERAIQHSLSFEFGDRIGLAGYDVDETLLNIGYGNLVLYWEALADVAEDYTVFVHVVDEEGQVVAQHDSQPRTGYYPTSYWREGETIEDEHVFPFPGNLRPGTYRVLAGIYLAETMERLPAFDSNGDRVRHDQILLREFEILSPTSRRFMPLVLQLAGSEGAAGH